MDNVYCSLCGGFHPNTTAGCVPLKPVVWSPIMDWLPIDHYLLTKARDQYIEKFLLENAPEGVDVKRLVLEHHEEKWLVLKLDGVEIARAPYPKIRFTTDGEGINE